MNIPDALTFIFIMSVLLTFCGCETTTQTVAWDNVRHVKYNNDEGPDNWKLPAVTRADKEGDCEDFALMHYEFLTGLGLNPDFIVGFNPVTDEHHAWVVADGYYYSNHDIGKGSLPGYTINTINTDRRFLALVESRK